MKDTHALGELFNGLVAKPTRTYITGHSMGGHITGVANEQYPNDYAGALPMCGVMGDVKLFDYFLDYSLVAQALAGIQAQFPPPPDYLTTVVPAVKATLGPSFPSALNAQGQKLKAVTMNDTGGQRPVFDVGWLVWDSPALQNGNFLFSLGAGDGTVGVAPGSVVGNVDTVYQLDSDPALTAEEQALNDSVLRVAPTPQGLQPSGLANIPPILGTSRVPVLSLHTLGDLFVPFSMEQIYARRMAANGASGLLIERAIRDVGHCGFTVAEQEAAFADLVRWAEQGVHPHAERGGRPDVRVRLHPRAASVRPLPLRLGPRQRKSRRPVRHRTFGFPSTALRRCSCDPCRGAAITDRPGEGEDAQLSKPCRRVHPAPPAPAFLSLLAVKQRVASAGARLSISAPRCSRLSCPPQANRSSQVGSVNPDLGPLWGIPRRQELVTRLLTQLDLTPLSTHEFPISRAPEA